MARNPTRKPAAAATATGPPINPAIKSRSNSRVHNNRTDQNQNGPSKMVKIDSSFEFYGSDEEVETHPPPKTGPNATSSRSRDPLRDYRRNSIIRINWREKADHYKKEYERLVAERQKLQEELNMAKLNKDVEILQLKGEISGLEKQIKELKARLKNEVTLEDKQKWLKDEAQLKRTIDDMKEATAILRENETRLHSQIDELQGTIKNQAKTIKDYEDMKQKADENALAAAAENELNSAAVAAANGQVALENLATKFRNLLLCGSNSKVDPSIKIRVIPGSMDGQSQPVAIDIDPSLNGHPIDTIVKGKI